MGVVLEELLLSCDPETVRTPEHGREMMKELYEHLTILDDKARALMTFDAILVAGITFIADKAEKEIPLTGLSGLAGTVLGVVVLLALLAVGLCLYISRVSFPLFGGIKMTPAVPANDTRAASPAHLDFHTGLEVLEGALIRRRKSYLWALRLTSCAIVLLFVTCVALLAHRITIH
jgi:hypothetical protein